jgi:predicted peroxiredoxin
MSRYLLIESKDAWESADSAQFVELAAELAKDQHEVTFVLIQNGVLAARPSELGGRLSALADAGVEVLADAFSLKERGISEARLVPKVRATTLATVIERLADGAKALWH